MILTRLSLKIVLNPVLPSTYVDLGLPCGLFISFNETKCLNYFSDILKHFCMCVHILCVMYY